MALIYKNNIANGTILGIWKKEEELDLLENVFVLNKYEKEYYQKITNNLRKSEFITTRILLTELLESRKTIVYNADKKPEILNSNLNISVSHSKNFVAIIVSGTYIPGVDIEYISNRVEKVKHKFLTEKETHWIKDLVLLTCAWSTKEAIFKIFGTNLDFKDIELVPFKLEDDSGIFAAKVLKPKFEESFKLNYMFIEDDLLVYSLKK